MKPVPPECWQQGSQPTVPPSSHHIRQYQVRRPRDRTGSVMNLRLKSVWDFFRPRRYYRYVCNVNVRQSLRSVSQNGHIPGIVYCVYVVLCLLCMLLFHISDYRLRPTIEAETCKCLLKRGHSLPYYKHPKVQSWGVSVEVVLWPL